MFRPMSDEDDPYGVPGEKMTLKRFFKIAMLVVLFIIAVMFLWLIVEYIDYKRTKAKNAEQRETAAREDLREFLCGSCGLSASDYKVTKSSEYEHRSILTFEVQGKSYTLQDGHYSDYLTEEFREKVKAHLTGVLAGSELMRDVKFEISKIEFSGDGPTKDNLISTLLTRDKMDRILAPKTEENKEFFDKCRLQILCEITVSGADGRTFSEGQFAGIEDLWYVKWFRIRNGEEAGK